MKTISALTMRIIASVVAILMLIGAPAAVSDGTTLGQGEDIRLRVNVISDIHMETNNTFRKNLYVRELKNMAKYLPDTDILLTCGDNTMNGFITEYPILNGLTASLLPNTLCLPVCGNHDVGNGEGDFQELKTRFIRQYNAFHPHEPIDRMYYAREINGYRFILLADCEKVGDCKTAPTELVEWFGEQLDQAEQTGKPVFVGCHYPSSYLDQDLRDLIAAHHNVFYFSGHLHRHSVDARRIVYGRDDLWDFNLPRVTEYNESNNTTTNYTGLGVNVSVTDTAVTINVYNYYTAKLVDSKTIPIVH